MSVVRYEPAGEIGYIVVNSPPVNALSVGVRQGLLDAIGAFAADKARVAVLYCEGRTFIAGADISEFGKAPVPPFLPDVIAAIEASTKPVIAALHGTVLGGGLEVALGAHGRIGLNGTRVGLPEVTLGLMPGAGGTQRLPRAIGIEKAAEVITSGRQIGAAEALDLGILDALSDAADARTAGTAEAQRWLAEGRAPRRLSEVPAPGITDDALAALRAKVDRTARGQVAPLRALDTMIEGLSMPFPAAMQHERSAFLALMQTPERAALIHAFFAERAAAQMPVNARPRQFQRVGIIGGGTMGQGIAAAALNAGLDVTLIERDQAAADKALAGIARMQDEAVKRGKLSQADRDAMI